MGLQYTRLLHEEAMWASFCSLPRESWSVCTCLSASYNYDCVGRLFWYACGWFCVPVLSPNIEGLACNRGHACIPRPDHGHTAASPNFSPPPPRRPPPSVVFERGFVVYLFTLQSHLWITVLVISGFGGLIQIPLFVNTATFPKLI